MRSSTWKTDSNLKKLPSDLVIKDLLCIQSSIINDAFDSRQVLYQPNQARPDIMGAPSSLSAAITFGAISIRLYN